ncbi:MAG: hypothetical protein IKH57_25870 [Clostridia bacterium]|nr:hypothetical protein [Clostridia bacterium]
MCCKADENVMIQVTDELTVTITVKEYRELMEKAIRLEAIADSIRQRVDEDKYSKVDDDVVLLMTGTLNYEKKPEESEMPEAKDE